MNNIIKLFAIVLVITSACGIKATSQDLAPGIYAKISTAKGDMILQLEYKKTPMTVANFVGLAEGKLTVYDTIRIDKPFYDGIVFHRVIKNFMIQGGDPGGNGMGGPGYKFPDEIVADLMHSGPGILSMANSGPATNGSQFFITHTATPHLNGKHTVFGHIVKGQNVVDSIAQGDVMKKVEIIRVGDEAKKWNATNEFQAAVSGYVEKEKESQKYFELVKNMSEADYSKFMFNEIKKKYPEAKQSASGLVYLITETGNGENPIAGDNMTVHYRGTFRIDEKEFDSSYGRGEPMSFVYKEQRMIPGFEEGLAMLRKGGKAKVFIPYYQAYGPQGRPGAIPPYSDLVFDLEIVDIAAGTGHAGHGH